FILGGTPRNLPQAKHFDWFLETNQLPLDKVILLELNDDEARARVHHRAHTENRSDDENEATIKERFRIYHEDTEPLIQHYEKLGKLLRINGSPDIQTIFNNIVSKL